MRRVYESWTRSEREYLLKNVGNIPIEEIYAHFPHRSKRSVELKILRLRLRVIKTVAPERVTRNLVLEMLRNRIGDPSNFQPQRDFYERVEIGQKRFWALYRGELNLTENEYKRLAKEWNVSLEDAFEMRQMELKLK